MMMRGGDKIEKRRSMQLVLNLNALSSLIELPLSITLRIVVETPHKCRKHHLTNVCIKSETGRKFKDHKKMSCLMMKLVKLSSSPKLVVPQKDKEIQRE